VPQWTQLQRLNPENKGGLPSIPFRAGYRNGGYSLSHTWSHAISLTILTSGVRWHFSGLTPGDIPQIWVFFVLLLHSLSLIVSLIVSHYLSSPSPVFLPHSSFDVWTYFWVKEHHLDLGVYIP
jgi:hypothetical protein